MPRPPIIALVGVDGAGKTTQARLLVDDLAASGVRVARFHNPAGRRSMGRLAARTGRRTPVELLGRRGRLTVEVSVRAWRIAIAILTSRLMRQAAVMDRYACCQIALARARDDPGAGLVERAMRRFAHADLVCFLAVEPTIAHARVLARGEDREDLAELVALDAAYRALPDFASFALIDAGRGPGDVRAEIRAVLAERLPALAPGAVATATAAPAPRAAERAAQAPPSDAPSARA